jgi:hypothetical protein
MRHPLKIVLAVVLAAAFAAGCGSDDEKSGDGDAADKTKSSAQAAGDESKSEDEPESDSKSGGAKPKKAGARAKMVKCLEGDGFELSHEGQDADKATDYTIEGTSGRKKRAQIVIHSSKNDAEAAARKKGEEKAINAVAFGRAEFIRYEATDTEAGQIVNCVAAGYTR